jgi:hypothetical protein
MNAKLAQDGGHMVTPAAIRSCAPAASPRPVFLRPPSGRPGRTGPRIVARAATADSERNLLQSLDALAATGTRLVLVGHGEPWTDGAEAIVAGARAAGVG